MPLPDFASSTSRAMMRPCGPEPWIRDTSMPASLARRRARGDANTRPPDAAPCGAAACGLGAAAAGAVAGAGFGPSAFGEALGALGGAAAVCGFGAGAPLAAPAAADF